MYIKDIRTGPRYIFGYIEGNTRVNGFKFRPTYCRDRVPEIRICLTSRLLFMFSPPYAVNERVINLRVKLYT